MGFEPTVGRTHNGFRDGWDQFVRVHLRPLSCSLPGLLSLGSPAPFEPIQASRTKLRDGLRDADPTVATVGRTGQPTSDDFGDAARRGSSSGPAVHAKCAFARWKVGMEVGVTLLRPADLPGQAWSPASSAPTCPSIARSAPSPPAATGISNFGAGYAGHRAHNPRLCRPSRGLSQGQPG